MNDRYTIDNLRPHGMGGYYLRVTSNVTDGVYQVKSTSRTGRGWTCTCDEFFGNVRAGNGEMMCRHIHVCLEHGQIELEQAPIVIARPQGEPEHIRECPECGTTEYTKAGRCSGKQMYRCRTCNRRYVDAEPGFRRCRYPPQVVTSSLNMLMSGMSYRKVQEHMRSQGVQVSGPAIYGWVKKYTRILNEYVNALEPVIGRVWSIDEAVINIRRAPKIHNFGHAGWLWTAMDPRTRLVLATVITRGRGQPEAVSVMDAAVEAGGRPDYMVSDSLQAYKAAIRHHMPEVAHVKTKSIEDVFTNLAVERWHNEIREKTRIMRGLYKNESAQIFFDLHRIHHNFVRPHLGLDGKTPAEAAGLVTPEVSQGKYRSLIQMASVKGTKSVARKLGAYHKQVAVVAGTEETRVTPKAWLENDDWKSVHKILVGMGFAWMFTAWARCWVRPHTAPPAP